MLGVIVNTVTVIVGSLVGLLIKKGIPDRISKAIMSVLGLVTMYIGIDGALAGNNAIVLIVSLVFGTVIGELIDIDNKIERVGKFIENRFKPSEGKVNIAQGFMTACLLWCVGAMTIVGALQAGLNGDNTLYFTKAILDMISSCILASTLGIGVLFGAAFVFVFQGGLVLMAGLLQNVLSNQMMVAEITCAGSVMIIGLGLNLLGLTKIKVANMLPAILLVPFVYWAASYIPL